MASWQPFLSFYVWGVHWRHLANTTEPSVCGGYAALCQITLTTCYCYCYGTCINTDCFKLCSCLYYV